MNIEHEINDYRKLLKEKNVADIEDQKYGYQRGVHYMDVVNDCEKLGDYVMNVVEAHVNRRLDLSCFEKEASTSIEKISNAPLDGSKGDFYFCV